MSSKVRSFAREDPVANIANAQVRLERMFTAMAKDIGSLTNAVGAHAFAIEALRLASGLTDEEWDAKVNAAIDAASQEATRPKIVVGATMGPKS